MYNKKVETHLPFAICHLPKRGQAALTTILLIGGVVLFIGITMTLLATALLNGTAGYIFGVRAATVAQGGVEDALLRLDRDKDFAPASAYSVPLGGSPSASVTVTQNSPVAGRATIVSTATVNGYTKTVQAIVSISSSTGATDLLMWNFL